MALTRTLIKTMARKNAADTDTTNPLWSDTEANVLVENWQADMASYLRYPRGEASVIPTVAGQASYDLPADWLASIQIVLYNADGFKTEVKYRPEDDISEVDPNWRNQIASQYGVPRFFFPASSVTPGASFARKYILYPTPNQVWSVLHIYTKIPTAIANDSDVPVFPAPMHMLAVYYLSWQMNLPTDAEKAEYYRKLYIAERIRLCGEGRKESENNGRIEFR